MQHLILILIIFLTAITGTGCAIKPVKPWEKDLLAQKKLQLTPNPLEAYLDEHIYFSKEASSGGYGIGEGGFGSKTNSWKRRNQNSRGFSFRCYADTGSSIVVVTQL